MPIARFQMPDGRIARFEVPEGTTPEQAQEMIAQSLPQLEQAPVEPQSGFAKGMRDQPEPGFGEKLNTGLRDIPRQIGLTARYGLEGMGQVADIVGAPLAVTMNKAFPASQSLSGLVTGQQPKQRFGTPSQNMSEVANRLGLPQPRNATERVVGDASRLLAGAGGMVKSAQVAGRVVPALTQLAARPGLQAASAIGSGTAGGYTRETGGSPTSQFVASLLGGVAAPGAVAGVGAVGNSVKNLANSFRPQPANITIQIRNAVENAGYRPADLPRSVMNQLEADAAAATRMGQLSPDALRRLVDYRLVGATPARGNLTLNPVDLTRQHNLAKIGANSSNAKLQELAMRPNTNTGALIRNLNELGANTTDDAFAAGQQVLGGLGKTASNRQQAINAAYENARNQTGVDAAIDPAAFTQRAGYLLKQNLLEGSLPPDVRRILNDAATGKLPLTVRTAEQIKTAMGNLQRSSSDGGTRRAIGLVRQALDDAPIAQGQGAEAVKAFNAARQLNRNWRGLVEKTPALQAIEDGVQPDKFVQQYVIQGSGKGNVMDVARLKNAVKDSPEALQAIRGQILSHLKSKATSGKPDEAMTFSQSGYNNALAAIGERKLRMFFTKPEIDKMKSVGRVAMYEQIQPSGSAVNNSNTAAMAIGRLLDGILNKVPFGEAAIGGPAKNIGIAIQGSGMTNVPKALTMQQPKAPMAQRLPLPLLLTPGLLEDRSN